MTRTSKHFLCKVCNWSGYKPDWITTKKGYSEKVILICPECSNEIK